MSISINICHTPIQKDAAAKTVSPHRDILFVSESGVSSTVDAAKLREIDADAVLIGEALMRAPDKKARLNELRGKA